MGHLGSSKDLYAKLHDKIDNSYVHAPYSEAFREILEALFSREDAELLVRMPYGANTFDEVQKVVRRDPVRLRRQLDDLCNRGLVIDLFAEGEYRYIIAPMVVGIFEFTMMRTDDRIDSKKMSELFHAYLESGLIYSGNYSDGEQISLFRTVPYEEAVRDTTEILDYEKAASIIESQERFTIGLCSCRHEKHHLGTKACDDPLEMCTSYGKAAEFAIRRGLAREWSRSEALEHLARSRERGLVLCADNVQNNPTFICHCCGCCCNALAGLTKHGFTNAVTTSNYIARFDADSCDGCGLCAERCPLEAIRMAPRAHGEARPAIDDPLCLGCGVCALKCPTGSMHLARHGQRVIHPENMFARLILGSLERGTLQNMFFDNPNNLSQKFLRAFVGGFLKLPTVKRGLMSDQFRSRFLKFMAEGVDRRGQGWIARM